MDMRYYNRLAAAWLRGMAERTGSLSFSCEELIRKRLEELSEEEVEEILEEGRRAGVKLYAFKKSHSEMPRVRRVLGFLRSVAFDSLLGVGSGRGVFLFPFLDSFPWTEVTAEDILPRRAEFLRDLSRGGISRLHVVQEDICRRPLPEKSVDVVTLLEVLEHIPDVEQAVKAAVDTARKYVVVTVPSKPDSNPEHIHLLTKQRLTELFQAAGCVRLHFDGVPGHLFMTGTCAAPAEAGPDPAPGTEGGPGR